jgi:hypothetical protein
MSAWNCSRNCVYKGEYRRCFQAVGTGPGFKLARSGSTATGVSPSNQGERRRSARSAGYANWPAPRRQAAFLCSSDTFGERVAEGSVVPSRERRLIIIVVAGGHIVYFGIRGGAVVGAELHRFVRLRGPARICT